MSFQSSEAFSRVWPRDLESRSNERDRDRERKATRPQDGAADASAYWYPRPPLQSCLSKDRIRRPKKDRLKSRFARRLG